MKDKISSVIVILLALSLLFIFLYSPHNDLDYLKGNTFYFDLNNEDPFNGFDYDFDDKKLVLAGEVHATAFNYLFKTKFFQFLSDNHNFGIFLDEVGFSISCITMKTMNENSIFLDYIFNELNGTLAATAENFQFYTDLFSFLDTQSDISFFTYLGIDLEHQYDLSKLCLDLIYRPYNNSVLPYAAEIHQLEQELESYEYNPHLFPMTLRSEIRSLISNISNQLETDPSNFAFLGDEDFQAFSFLIMNTMNTFTFLDLRAQNKQIEALNFREEIIHANFNFFDTFLDGKYFGSWGNAHVLQNPLDFTLYTDPFITQLSQNRDFEDKIVSMMIYYQDSKFLRPDNGIEVIQNYPPFLPGLDMTDFSNSKETMIVLDRENSPYLNNFLLLSNAVDNDKVTTDYFQILIIAVKSSACSQVRN